MQAGIEPARDEVAAHRVPISPLHETGQGGWIRTNVLLLPRQAGTTGLPYTLMIGLPGRSRTCILRVRSTVLIRLSYGKKMEPRMGIDPISPG